MLIIMKNAMSIFLKRKSFLITTFLLPIILVFVISIIYGGNSNVKIGLINKDQGEFAELISDRINNIENIKVIEVKNEDKVDDDLIFHSYEMLITIDEDYTEKLLDGIESTIKVKSISKSEVEDVVANVIESESRSLATICKNIDVKEQGIDNVIDTFNDSKPEYEIIKGTESPQSINNSLGMILYLIYMSTLLSTVFLIEDESLGIKDRVLMSKVSEQKYYSGMILTFFVLSAFTAIEYYAICKIFKYEFGFKQHYLLLVLLLLFVLLGVMFNVLVGILVKKKNVFNLVCSTMSIPIFMLSGCFWPYEVMGKSLQKIGEIFPTRWIMRSITNLQEGMSVSSIIPEIIGMIALSIILFLTSVVITKCKRGK